MLLSMQLASVIADLDQQEQTQRSKKTLAIRWAQLLPALSTLGASASPYHREAALKARSISV